MTARYTFLVCSCCGVQSPPIIDRLRSSDLPGWLIDATKFNVIAICPACRDDQEKNPDRAA
jgi:hypothetical protein